MKTTRREFLGTSAGIVGSVALGSAGTTWANDGAEDAPTRLLTYHGLRPTDPGGRVGLRNPERGWRIETVIAEPARKTFGPAHHLTGRVPPVYAEDWWMLDAARSEPFGLTLVQAYCYLTEFADKPISDEKLALLEESFDNLRHRGLKAMLRFAYERDMGLKEGPTPDWILRHIDQLQPVLRKNVDVNSSFSLAHSYSEREGKPYSIDHWLSAAIEPESLRQAAMPVSDGWFEDGFGQPAPRSPFEYIQDHLGYRLELQSARIPEQVKTGAPFRVEIELINRGFSTLHNPRPVCLSLMDRTGKVIELPMPDVDPRQWQPFRPGDGEFKPIVHRITWRGTLPAGCPPGWQQIGLWLPDAAESLRRDPRYAVRAANRDVPWWTDVRGQYGINVLGVVEVVP